MAFRGRGRGRGGGGGGFGSRGISVADIVGSTMDELGMSHTQLVNLTGEGNALFPPVKLPAPVKLSDSDMYLVHKMRVVSDRMTHLYPVSNAADAEQEVIHVTAPEVNLEDPNMCYVPKEIYENIRHDGAVVGGATSAILRPRAFEQTLKSLEQREQKSKGPEDATAAAAFDDLDMDEDDLEDDEDVDYGVDHYASENDDDDFDEEAF